MPDDLGAHAGLTGPLLAGSALTRFAIFQVGLNSAEDLRYIVVPQRERLAARSATPDASAGTEVSLPHPG